MLFSLVAYLWAPPSKDGHHLGRWKLALRGQRGSLLSTGDSEAVVSALAVGGAIGEWFANPVLFHFPSLQLAVPTNQDAAQPPHYCRSQGITAAAFLPSEPHVPFTCASRPSDGLQSKRIQFTILCCIYLSCFLNLWSGTVSPAFLDFPNCDTCASYRPVSL